MKVIKSQNQNSCFKNRYVSPNNLFNQIETDLRLIKDKCEAQILKTNSHREKEMYDEVLNHLNQMIQDNTDKQIIFKQNHTINIDDSMLNSTNSNFDSQIKYGVTLVLYNETIEEEFQNQLSFKQFYNFLLEKYSMKLKSNFVILDQDTNIINIDDWNQPFIQGNNNSHFLFIIQSLQVYLMSQQQEKKESQMINIQKESVLHDNESVLHDYQRFKIFKSYNINFKDMNKEQEAYQIRSSIKKYGQSLLASIQNKCNYCNQQIQGQQILLRCFHIFHEDCLSQMLKLQIQNGQSTLNCVCNDKIKINERILLDMDLKDDLYKNQINAIYMNKQELFMKCRKCQFFYIKQQNISGIKQACLICQV